jgi:hypothetical protein
LESTLGSVIALAATTGVFTALLNQALSYLREWWVSSSNKKARAGYLARLRFVSSRTLRSRSRITRGGCLSSRRTWLTARSADHINSWLPPSRPLSRGRFLHGRRTMAIDPAIAILIVDDFATTLTRFGEKLCRRLRSSRPEAKISDTRGCSRPLRTMATSGGRGSATSFEISRSHQYQIPSWRHDQKTPPNRHTARGVSAFGRGICSLGG